MKTSNLGRWVVGIGLVAITMGASSAGAAWPKGADPTGRYLVDGKGKPFFWLGDTAWNLFQIPNREDAELSLSTRGRQGFSVIQAGIVMGEERVAGTARPNAYGDTAFTDNDPAKPRLTPGNGPSVAEEYDYWDHADYVIERAQVRGLTLGILPLFVGWRGDGYKSLKLANACTYGNTEVWNFSSCKDEAYQDWKLALHSPGAIHLGVLRKIFDSLEWWRLVPGPSDFAVVTGAVSMLSVQGDMILVYLSRPGTISIHMGQITDRTQATWIDPRTGNRTRAAMLPNQGPTFSSPSDWEDALLLLQSAQ
ncbi:MAG: glycoside hydrolase family 140 protein [Planctomycetes bacterium]|nr:glycoside hydrolase family 140 protein [Planctomycetota bacterium]